MDELLQRPPSEVFSVAGQVIAIQRNKKFKDRSSGKSFVLVKLKSQLDPKLCLNCVVDSMDHSIGSLCQPWVLLAGAVICSFSSLKTVHAQLASLIEAPDFVGPLAGASAASCSFLASRMCGFGYSGAITRVICWPLGLYELDRRILLFSLAPSCQGPISMGSRLQLACCHGLLSDSQWRVVLVDLCANAFEPAGGSLDFRSIVQNRDVSIADLLQLAKVFDSLCSISLSIREEQSSRYVALIMKVLLGFFPRKTEHFEEFSDPTKLLLQNISASPPKHSCLDPFTFGSRFLVGVLSVSELGSIGLRSLDGAHWLSILFGLSITTGALQMSRLLISSKWETYREGGVLIFDCNFGTFSHEKKEEEFLIAAIYGIQRTATGWQFCCDVQDHDGNRKLLRFIDDAVAAHGVLLTGQKVRLTPECDDWGALNISDLENIVLLFSAKKLSRERISLENLVRRFRGHSGEWLLEDEVVACVQGCCSLIGSGWLLFDESSVAVPFYFDLKQFSLSSSSRFLKFSRLVVRSDSAGISLLFGPFSYVCSTTETYRADTYALALRNISRASIRNVFHSASLLALRTIPTQSKHFATGDFVLTVLCTDGTADCLVHVINRFLATKCFGCGLDLLPKQIECSLYLLPCNESSPVNNTFPAPIGKLRYETSEYVTLEFLSLDLEPANTCSVVSRLLNQWY